MLKILCFLFVLHLLTPANPYVLITANVDDLQKLTKQLMTSPAAVELQSVMKNVVSIDRLMERFRSLRKSFGVDVKEPVEPQSNSTNAEVNEIPESSSDNNSTLGVNDKINSQKLLEELRVYRNNLTEQFNSLNKMLAQMNI